MCCAATVLFHVICCVCSYFCFCSSLEAVLIVARRNTRKHAKLMQELTSRKVVDLIVHSLTFSRNVTDIKTRRYTTVNIWAPSDSPCTIQPRRDASPRFRYVSSCSAGDGVPGPYGIWFKCACAGVSDWPCLWDYNSIGRDHGGPWRKRYSLFISFPSLCYMFLCMQKILKFKRGWSLHQQNLLSPTENTAP